MNLTISGHHLDVSPALRAECSIQVKGNALHAASKHFDLYAAIDELADKLDRRVLSYKTRKLAVRNVASRHELALSIQS